MPALQLITLLPATHAESEFVRDPSRQDGLIDLLTLWEQRDVDFLDLYRPGAI